MQEKKNIIQAKGLWKSLINSAIYCLLHMLMCPVPSLPPPPVKLLWQKDREMERKQKINTHHFKEGQTHKKRTKDFWPWIKNYLTQQPLEILFWFFPLFPLQKYSEISAQPEAWTEKWQPTSNHCNRFVHTGSSRTGCKDSEALQWVTTDIRVQRGEKRLY